MREEDHDIVSPSKRLWILWHELDRNEVIFIVINHFQVHFWPSEDCTLFIQTLSAQ